MHSEATACPRVEWLNVNVARRAHILILPPIPERLFAPSADGEGVVVHRDYNVHGAGCCVLSCVLLAASRVDVEDAWA